MPGVPGVTRGTNGHGSTFSDTASDSELKMRDQIAIRMLPFCALVARDSSLPQSEVQHAEKASAHALLLAETFMRAKDRR